MLIAGAELDSVRQGSGHDVFVHGPQGQQDHIGQLICLGYGGVELGPLLPVGILIIH